MTQKSSSISLIIGLLLLAGVGWYGYDQFQQFDTARARLSQADAALLELEQDRTQATAEYQSAQKDAVDQASTQTEKVDKIFPKSEELTGLTRLLDEFAFQNHFRNNPFFISQLTYGEPGEPKEGAAYRVLPITLNLDTSERNLQKFLEFINNSGSLSGGVPLLAVQGLTIQTNQQDPSVMKAQVTLHAYLQSL